MRKKLFTVFIFTKINTRRFFRDKLAIFFTIAFPLIFLFVFGGIFGNSGDANFNVGLINQSKSEFSQKYVKETKKSDSLKVDENIKTIDAAKDAMNRGELDAAIILPKGFGEIDQTKGYPTGKAEVIYSQNNQQAGQTDDPLPNLNTALAKDGLFLYIPDNVTIEKPIQVINLLNAAENTFAVQRNLFVCGKNSEATIVFCDHTLNQNYYILNNVSECVVDRDARFSFLSLQNQHNGDVNLTHLFGDVWENANLLTNT